MQPVMQGSQLIQEDIRKKGWILINEWDSSILVISNQVSTSFENMIHYFSMSFGLRSLAFFTLIRLREEIKTGS